MSGKAATGDWAWGETDWLDAADPSTRVPHYQETSLARCPQTGMHVLPGYAGLFTFLHTHCRTTKAPSGLEACSSNPPLSYEVPPSTRVLVSKAPATLIEVYFIWFMRRHNFRFPWFVRFLPVISCWTLDEAQNPQTFSYIMAVSASRSIHERIFFVYYQTWLFKTPGSCMKYPTHISLQRGVSDVHLHPLSWCLEIASWQRWPTVRHCSRIHWACAAVLLEDALKTNCWNNAKVKP